MIEKIQIICGDFDESIKGLPDESVGRLFKALIDFANDRDASDSLKGDAVASALFPVMKQHIIRNEEYRQYRAENGKKGGRPKNLNKPNDNLNEPNIKQTLPPNLTLPYLTNNNIKHTGKKNKFTEGAISQKYDFEEVEKRKVKN